MIRLSDAGLLAVTKLRARRFRLVITVFIASLLFGLLIASSLVVRGVFASVEQFSKEAFGERYIVQGMPVNGQNFNETQNPEVLDKAQKLRTDQIAKKKTEAKRLNIPYDEKSERVVVTEYDGPNGKEKSLDLSSPLADQALMQYEKTHPLPGFADFKKSTESYSPSHYYELLSMPIGPGVSARSMQVLKDGKESFTDNTSTQADAVNQNGLSNFSSRWALMSDDLLVPFLLPGANVKQGKDGSIPVVAPYSAVEQLLKLKALPSNATADQKLARLKEVRGRAKDITFQVCYRNTTSVSRVSTAKASQDEIARNKTNKDYQKQSLVYDLPNKPCGDVVVSRDVRLAEEKTLGNKQQEFEELFGVQPSKQEIMNFRIVGISPDLPTGASIGVTEALRVFAASSLGQASWITPISAQKTVPLLDDVFQPNKSSLFSGQSTYFVELPSPEIAKKFIADKECKPDYSPGNYNSDPTASCIKNNRPFILMPFGSNSLALGDMKQSFQKFFFIAAAAVAAIATLVLMGLIGRMITDSRRETAVFRAIGATRLDIVKVYLLYIACCVVMICAIAGAIGFILTQIVIAKQQETFTVQALLIFNSQNLDQVFSLSHFYILDILKLAAIAAASGLLSSFVPLLRNVRRNPIKDMRDDG